MDAVAPLERQPGWGKQIMKGPRPIRMPIARSEKQSYVYVSQSDSQQRCGIPNGEDFMTSANERTLGGFCEGRYEAELVGVDNLEPRALFAVASHGNWEHAGVDSQFGGGQRRAIFRLFKENAAAFARHR